jgi:hypothetical protein
VVPYYLSPASPDLRTVIVLMYENGTQIPRTTVACNNVDELLHLTCELWNNYSQYEGRIVCAFYPTPTPEKKGDTLKVYYYNMGNWMILASFILFAVLLLDYHPLYTLTYSCIALLFITSLLNSFAVSSELDLNDFYGRPRYDMVGWAESKIYNKSYAGYEVNNQIDVVNVINLAHNLDVNGPVDSYFTFDKCVENNSPGPYRQRNIAFTSMAIIMSILSWIVILFENSIKNYLSSILNFRR